MLWTNELVRLCLAAAVLVASWLSAVMAYAGPFDFPPSDFNIMDADGTQVIGHGHYEVTPDGKGHETAFGEDPYQGTKFPVTNRDSLIRTLRNSHKSAVISRALSWIQRLDWPKKRRIPCIFP
jgi:hypothetical protein